MNRVEYIDEIRILGDSIGHNFEADYHEIKDMYKLVRNIESDEFKIICSKIQRPCYPNITDFTYVKYILQEIKKLKGETQ